MTIEHYIEMLEEDVKSIEIFARICGLDKMIDDINNDWRFDNEVQSNKKI